MAGRYDREFKLEAIGLATELGNTATAVEQRLGISQGCISRWKREFRENGDKAFHGKGHLPLHSEELRRLRRENERLRRERDILKKVVAIFTEDPQRYSGS